MFKFKGSHINTKRRVFFKIVDQAFNEIELVTKSKAGVINRLGGKASKRKMRRRESLVFQLDNNAFYRSHDN